MRQIHILIFGRVQGVFFRAYIQKKAKDLALSGWVRNTTTGQAHLPAPSAQANGGQVEAVFEGGEAALEKMIHHCRQGPASANVEKIEVIWKKAKNLQAFKILV